MIEKTNQIGKSTALVLKKPKRFSNLKIMTKNKVLPVQSAIDLLKSGGSLDNVVISDLDSSKVNVMDALLLAKNGCLVPDGNIEYNDEQIQYDPDFDDVDWGKP